MPTEREYIRKMLRENPRAAAKLLDGVRSGTIKSVNTADQDALPEEVLIVAGPVDNGIEGAIQHPCICGKVLFIAPSTQTLMAKVKNATVMCLECIMKLQGPAN